MAVAHQGSRVTATDRGTSPKPAIRSEAGPVELIRRTGYGSTMPVLQLSAPLSIPALFVVGVGAGVLATLAMDLVMRRLEEGETPPRIASGVLTDTEPDRSPEGVASAVHYVAGALTGPLFVWLYLVAAAVVGAGTTGVVAATLACYPLMVGFFTFVVLPRSRGLSRQRLSLIRRAWAVEAAVYLLVIAPLIRGATGLL